MSAEPPAGGAVLDASALLAYLQREPGGDVVRRLLTGAVISSVNWAEVVGKLGGLPAAAVRHRLAVRGMVVVPFTVEAAELAGALAARTRSVGLSLGDRACLATAAQLGLPAYTADRTWLDLEVGVEVRAIR